MKTKKPPLALFDIKDKGIETKMNRNAGEQVDELMPLPQRIQKLLDLMKVYHLKKPEDMYFFIMYDIEDNKVRRLVSKYLEKKGCLRVQKSIFFATLHRNLYKEVTDTLIEIQKAYQNNDSIIALPVGEDMMNSLKLIGKELSYEFSRENKTTFFI